MGRGFWGVWRHFFQDPDLTFLVFTKLFLWYRWHFYGRWFLNMSGRFSRIKIAIFEVMGALFSDTTQLLITHSIFPKSITFLRSTPHFLLWSRFFRFHFYFLAPIFIFSRQPFKRSKSTPTYTPTLTLTPTPPLYSITNYVTLIYIPLKR